MADQSFDDDDNLDNLDRGDGFTVEDEDLDDDSSEEEESDENQEEDEDEQEEDEVIDTPPVKEPRIPKSRLDEVLSQRDEARERQLWLEEQLEKLITLQSNKEPQVKEPKQVYDFATAEQKYISLIIEGDTNQASQLRSEIDKERKAEMMELINGIKADAETKAKAESGKAVESERFNTLVETFKTKYSFLDDSSDLYNEEAVETINTLTAGYAATGKSRSEALRLAVNKVAPMYVKDEPASKTTLGNQRTQQAVKKATNASNKQPPQTPAGKSASKASDNTKIDILKMSDKDFDNLTEREKRILRGD